MVIKSINIFIGLIILFFLIKKSKKFVILKLIFKNKIPTILIVNKLQEG